MAERPRTADESRRPQDGDWKVLSLQDRGRTLFIPSVVRKDQTPGRACNPSCRRRTYPNYSRWMDEQLPRMDEGYQRLVHLTSNLVGASDPCLVLSTLQHGIAVRDRA